jgi:RNA polymerase sigma-70 factor, ECF subfamily
LSSSVTTRFPLVPPAAETAGSTLISNQQTLIEEVISDETLLTRFINGDGQALGFLFQRYGRLLRSVAARILGDGAEAEDLVQDLFLFVQRKSAVFDGAKSTARSWIVQMVYHRAISRRRYLVTRQFYSHEQSEGISEQVVGAATIENDYSADAVFGRNGLDKVIVSLSEDQRQTLKMHFFEGFTLTEISNKLGQPHGNIRNHYYRGLAQLRKHMAGSNVRAVGPYGK